MKFTLVELLYKMIPNLIVGYYSRYDVWKVLRMTDNIAVIYIIDNRSDINTAVLQTNILAIQDAKLSP